MRCRKKHKKPGTTFAVPGRLFASVHNLFHGRDPGDHGLINALLDQFVGCDKQNEIASDFLAGPPDPDAARHC